MAHKKGQGSSRNGRDSVSKRLGVKTSDGQSILSGGIILKQLNDQAMIHYSQHQMELSNLAKKVKILL